MNQKKGMIRGICISPRRGTAKYPVETAKIVPDWGIEEDAHGGKWHRQISLLALEKIEAFREKGADVRLYYAKRRHFRRSTDRWNDPCG